MNLQIFRWFTAASESEIQKRLRQDMQALRLTRTEAKFWRKMSAKCCEYITFASRSTGPGLDKSDLVRYGKKGLQYA